MLSLCHFEETPLDPLPSKDSDITARLSLESHVSMHGAPAFRATSGRRVNEGKAKLRAEQVSVGDRFTKVGAYSRVVYVVGSVVESHGCPPHVRLMADGGNDGILMSVSALLDDHFWSRAS
jgi:hypothetical protein